MIFLQISIFSNELNLQKVKEFEKIEICQKARKDSTNDLCNGLTVAQLSCIKEGQDKQRWRSACMMNRINYHAYLAGASPILFILFFLIFYWLLEVTRAVSTVRPLHKSHQS